MSPNQEAPVRYYDVQADEHLPVTQEVANDLQEAAGQLVALRRALAADIKSGFAPGPAVAGLLARGRN